MTTLRGVTIGCGYVADFQLAAWSQIAGVDIVAVADLDESKARRRAAQFGIPRVYTDYRAMIDEEQPDFVDIATPPPTHQEIVTFSASRALPILCQKPAAPDLMQLRAMVSAADEAGVMLMINENGRFQPYFRALASHLVSGAIGEVFYVNFTTRKRLSLPAPHFQQGFFAKMPRLMIYELGVHMLDTLRYLCGEMEMIYADIHRAGPAIAGEDVAVIHLRRPGCMAVVDLSWASFPTQQVSIPASWSEVRLEGTDGTLHLQREGTLRLIREDTVTVEQFPPDSIEQGYVTAQQHFIDCLRSQQEPETSGRDTLKTMELVFGAYHAASQQEIYRMGKDIGKLP